MPDIRFVTAPDETGLGRLVVNGRYFGLPCEVVAEYEALKTAAAANAAPEWLAKETFAVQYSPNCPKPYLVRLIGRGQGTLDMRSYTNAGEQSSKDVLGFGTSLAEAAENARSAREEAMGAIFK
jgi:hypothetical protein